MFRGLRIVPALAVEITLSALLLGPLLTTESMAQYFSDPKFFKYFLNVLGLIHYQLPGVFLQNPYPDVVNGSLWSVPYELECYAGLTILSIIALAKNKKAPLAVIILGAFVLLTVSQLRETHDLAVELRASRPRSHLMLFVGSFHLQREGPDPLFVAALRFMPRRNPGVFVRAGALRLCAASFRLHYGMDRASQFFQAAASVFRRLFVWGVFVRVPDPADLGQRASRSIVTSGSSCRCHL